MIRFVMGPFNRGRAERAVAAVIDFTVPMLIAAWLTMLLVGVLPNERTIAYWQAVALSAVVAAVMWPIRRRIKASWRRWRSRKQVNRG